MDVAGTELTDEDCRRLTHPLAGGVILFSRNYSSLEQLARLTAKVHALRNPALLIAVDQEGGRVQRFREGFTPIPPMRELGRAWDVNAGHARQLALHVGYVLAAALRAHGVDLTFAPVLDMDYGASSVIGDRALHSDPQAISELARALIQGFKQAGMSAVGKHFPGHGHVRADSHHEIPVDERSYAQSNPATWCRSGGDRSRLSGISGPRLYPQIDSRPRVIAVWLKQVLRGELEFDGVIFSDDLSWRGQAAPEESPGVSRRHWAPDATWWDMQQPGVRGGALRRFSQAMSAVSLARIAGMHGRAHAENIVKLREDPRYAKALHAIAGIGLRTANCRSAHELASHARS